ncbi:hypothetical protein [Streptomyces sp. PT12]|uniref:hypothetical protein n=1 Tax=Streptomyces sp. PT12 TaxID=1510197 RepID=UPI000DE35B51|nr:hypothetical protein [Streptomyces sp. PT12]RBM20210.1 hypothetical protein DEH69_08725 [Streptomyces sp. PT12]
MAEVWMWRSFSWLAWGILVSWAVLFLLPILMVIPADSPASGTRMLFLPVVSGVFFLARWQVGGRIRVHLYRNGLPATAEINQTKYRGSWGEGSEDAPRRDWYDTWLHVTPGVGVQPFDAFVRQGLRPGTGTHLAEGLLVQVVYDPETGLTALAERGIPGDFSLRKTLSKLGRRKCRH